MMLSAADFEDLFASYKRKERKPDSGDVPEPFEDVWADEDERLEGAQPDPDGVPDPVLSGVAFGMMPAAAAFGTASAMLAAYSRLLRN